MRLKLLRGSYPLAMTVGFALLGCSSSGPASSRGSGGGSTVGGSSQSAATGGATAAGAGNGGSAAGAAGATGGGGASAGQGGFASGGAGQPSTAGAAGTGTTAAQGGAAGASGGATAVAGRSGAGGSNVGGTGGLGGATQAGGSGGDRDAGNRDGPSIGGVGGAGGSAGGRTGTGGSAAAGSGTGGSVTGGRSTGGNVIGGSTTGGNGSAGAGAGGATSYNPCPGATQTLTVGSGQQYATVQAAVNAVSSGNSALVRISVKAGSYKEQVTINKPFVCLTGDSATTTTITNALGTDIVTGGTVLVTGNDFSAANIAFQNTGGDGSGQAVALMAKGQRQQFRDCRFLSYQDTLYTNTGTQYFRDCFIQGDTDYIFGDATAVFENCTMNNAAEGTAVTAPRTPQNTRYGFVFLGGSLTANPTTSTVRNNHVYLGRPWGPYAAAAFLKVAMGAHIEVDGWTTMSDNTLADTRFSEYQSTGAGANPTNPTRASRQLTDAQAADYTVAKVLSPWTPGYSQ